MLGGLLLSKILHILSHAIITNFGSPEIYGRFSLAVTIVILASFLGLGGLHFAALKYGGNLCERKIPSLAFRRLAAVLLSLSVLSSITVAIIITVCGKWYFPIFFHNKGIGNLVDIMVPALPFISILTISSYLFRSVNMFWPDVAIRNIARGLIFICFILLIWTRHGFNNYQYLGYAFLMSFIVAAAIGLVCLLRFTRTGTGNPGLQVPGLNTLLLYGFYMSAGTVVFEIMAGIDKLILGHFRPLEDAGRYGVISLLSRQVETLGIVASTVIMPTVALEYVKPKEKNKIVIRSLYLIAISGSLGLLALYFLAPWILGIMGNEYKTDSREFIILSSGFVLFSASAPLAAFLQANGKERSDLALLSFGLILNTVLLLYLVPEQGIFGATVSTTLSLVSIFILRLLLYAHVVHTGRFAVSA